MASLTPLADAGEEPPRKPRRQAADAEAVNGEPFLSPSSSLLSDVPVTLQARLGGLDMTIADLLALRAGSVLELRTKLSEPIGLYLNDALVARGEIVAVDDCFGIRIVEIAAG